MDRPTARFNTAPGRLIAETTVVPLLNRPLPLLKRRIPLPFFIGRLGLGSPIVFLPPAPPVHSERIVEMLSETGSLVRYEVLETGHLGNAEVYERFNEELAQVLESARQPVEAVG
jgi:hypothetical protein